MSRTHLITGAGSGIGRVVAERLLARGDEVWAAVRTPGRAPAGCVEVVVDLSDAVAVARLARWPGSFDSVVHAAGVVELGRVEELTAAAWHAQLGVNLVAPALLTRAVLPQLRELDEVAYLRFASVYQAFESLDDFESAIAQLRRDHGSAASASDD